MEVGEVDEVAIDDQQVTDAGACEVEGDAGAQGAAANEHDARIGKAILPGFADLREDGLPMISVWGLGWIHGRGWRSPVTAIILPGSVTQGEI
jgi:hypothetical protein